MGKSGINKRALASLGGEVYCFMADEDVAKKAAASGPPCGCQHGQGGRNGKRLYFLQLGNAPTALVRLYELIQEGKIHPKLIIGRAGRLCQCRAVQGIDYIPAGHSLYCGKEAEKAAAM